MQNRSKNLFLCKIDCKMLENKFHRKINCASTFRCSIQQQNSSRKVLLHKWQTWFCYVECNHHNFGCANFQLYKSTEKSMQNIMAKLSRYSTVLNCVIRIRSIHTYSAICNTYSTTILLYREMVSVRTGTGTEAKALCDWKIRFFEKLIVKIWFKLIERTETSRFNAWYCENNSTSLICT